MKRRNFIKKVSATSTITFLAPSILPSGVYGRTKANNKINIGQIGCGRIARFHDMPGIMQYDNARLIAVCDVDINRMKDAKKLVENYKIEPQYCIFFEDIARNLKPAHELGMKTVWIKNDEPWAAKFSDSDFINYKTDKLSNFLKEINENCRT